MHGSLNIWASRKTLSVLSSTSQVFKGKSQVNTRQSYTLHFTRAVHSRHPFPPIGDAAYRQRAGGGPSHGHRQHAQKFGKDRA